MNKKEWSLLLILVLIVVSILLIFYFSQQKSEADNIYIPQTIYKVRKEWPVKVMPSPEINAKESVPEHASANQIYENEWLKFLLLKTELCTKAFQSIKELDDFLDPKSKFYNNKKKVLSKFSEIIEAYYKANISLFDSYSPFYKKYLFKNKDFNSREWLKINNDFTGCDEVQDLGVLIISVFESSSVHNWSDREVNWIISRGIKLSWSYAQFGTYNGLRIGLGVIFNMISQNYLTPEEIYDIKSLRNEIVQAEDKFEMNSQNEKKVRDTAMEDFIKRFELRRKFSENIDYLYEKYPIF